MGRKLFALVAVCLFSLCAQGRADFKYVQSSQITGGMMAGMMNLMGRFNDKITQPSATTTYVKGAYLRTDSADGSYRIIDLKGRRMIQVNPAKHTYSEATFEQIREAMEKMEQRMTEAMRKQAHGKNAKVNITPKIEVKPTGRTQSLLGQNTRELNVKVDVGIQTTDTQNGTQSGSFSTNIDSWIAPSVRGYKEVSDFYKRMATEIGWTPAGFGMDPRIRSAMVQLYKGGQIPQGLPLLSVMSLMAAGQAPPQGAPQQQQQPQSSSASETPTTPNAAAMKALGGMFGGFGHKKKQDQDQDQQQTDQNSAASNQANSNALIEVTMRVVSYSAGSLDSALFQIPAGYTQEQSDLERALSGSSR